MSRSSVSVLLCLLALSDGMIACDTGCDREEGDPVRYEGGTIDAARTEYQTSGWNDAFVEFPAGRRLNLVHGLGVEPWGIFTWVAFDERPLPQTNVAESAGNQVVIEAVTDQVIQVRNDTCQDFFLRVVATVPPDLARDENAGGAGGAP